MARGDEKMSAAAIMACPVGCAVILDIFENSHLPLEYFADPLTRFRLLSHAVDICDIHAESNAQQLALEHAADHADIARSIVPPPYTWAVGSTFEYEFNFQVITNRRYGSAQPDQSKKRQTPPVR